MTWEIVINPKAAGGNAARNWPSVRDALESRGISFNARIAGSPGETCEMVRKAVLSGSDAIAVYGGDGTLSDAATILAEHADAPPLAAIPAGSGNDWLRSMGMSDPGIEVSLDAMQAYRLKLVDTAIASWRAGSRTFLNSSGTGLDALVLHRAIALRKRIGLPKLSYILSLAFSALSPPLMNGTLSSDGELVHEGPFLTFTAGVGRYSGGGMLLSPEAVPDDGMLDGLCMTPMGFFNIARNAGKIFDGTLHETEWARSARGKVLRFDNALEGPILMEVDGEPLNTGRSSWIELRIRPGTLRVVTPI